MSAISPWIIAARPKTLTAAFVPVLVGSVLAERIHGASWVLAAYAALSALFIQIATNFFNDAIDFKKGADSPARLGPLRVTQAGLLTPSAVMRGALICYLIATGFGLLLVFEAGWLILAIGLASLVFGYLYTGGPYPLAYHGLGDVFVLLFFGLIAVGGTFYIHTGYLHPAVLIAGTQVGAFAVVLIAINNLRDVEGDTRAGKQTLAVRFGRGFVRLEIAILYALALGLGYYWQLHGASEAFVFPLICALPAALVVQGIFGLPPSAAYNRFLGLAALAHSLFGVTLSVGLAWGQPG